MCWQRNIETMLPSYTMKEKNEKGVFLHCLFYQSNKLFARFAINTISRHVEEIDFINLDHFTFDTPR